MSDLSPGAELAWRIAAAEAAEARHEKIGTGHVVVGVFSLEKVSRLGPGQLAAELREAALREWSRVEDLSWAIGLDPARLRRRLRDRLGRGTHVHSGRSISRTDDCKAVFARATALAAGGPATCLHLVAAAAESLDPVLRAGLADLSVVPARLHAEALAAVGGAAAGPPEDAVPDAPTPAEPGPAPSTGGLGGEVPAEEAGVAPDEVAAGDGPDLMALEPFLRERMVGQDAAILQVAQRLRLVHARPSERRGPQAVFLFLGPRGVGKAEMARLLAEFLHGSSDALARVVMPDLTNDTAAARLLGAAAEDEGLLAGPLRRSPRSVVVLEDVDKAPARAFDVLLQLLDTGRLLDGAGRVADGREAILVLTTAADAGALRPELLARLDDMVVFRPLAESDVATIVDRHLGELAATFEREHGATLLVDPEAVRFIARTAAAEGVRELRPIVERLVQVPLSGLVLTGKIQRSPSWRVVYDEGGTYVIPG